MSKQLSNSLPPKLLGTSPSVALMPVPVSIMVVACAVWSCSRAMPRKCAMRVFWPMSLCCGL
jgi:hypothetical protein